MVIHFPTREREREGGERGREREGGRERERGRGRESMYNTLMVLINAIEYSIMHLTNDI